jgi:hypothetical protein
MHDGHSRSAKDFAFPLVFGGEFVREAATGSLIVGYGYDSGLNAMHIPWKHFVASVGREVDYCTKLRAWTGEILPHNLGRQLMHFPENVHAAGGLLRQYHPCMHWLHEHRFSIGILADSLTFLGGALLTRDAFRRLRDLKDKRTDDEFRLRFPQLNLTDQEWRDAIASMRWTVCGFGLIAVGFACQVLLRLAGE